MRLIDADALGIGMANEAIFKVRDYVHGWNSAIKNIDNAPTVDAIPVVRCKDCIRRYDTDECPMCYLSGGQYVEYTSDDSYCSRGERKGGDGKVEGIKLLEEADEN